MKPPFSIDIGKTWLPTAAFLVSRKSFISRVTSASKGIVDVQNLILSIQVEIYSICACVGNTEMHTCVSWFVFMLCEVGSLKRRRSIF